MDHVAFEFGDFSLDLEAAELRKGSERVHVERGPFAVLAMLVVNAGRVVSRDELRGALSRGAPVSECALNTAINHVRRALGQQRGERYPVELVSHRGYRFLGARAVAIDQQRAERHLWRQYALRAAQGPRTADECIQLADELVRAEVSRYGQV